MYRFLLSEKTYKNIKLYLNELKKGEKPGFYLSKILEGKDLNKITPEVFLEYIIRTKKPQIFAESQVTGDGSDWNLKELSILGDVGVSVSVRVYDNGRHFNPLVHENSFNANLLFIPGALLRSSGKNIPADFNQVTKDKNLCFEKFYSLYERRLLPLFYYADNYAKQKNKKAFITIPGLGCGQFAGKFIGTLGIELKKVLGLILENYGKNFSSVLGVYYDPYNECENEYHEIEGISFFVRPLLKQKIEKPQLCRPYIYNEKDRDFSNCELFSIVAWDHVSWPGNDFYLGSRVTDDGVKAAATDLMFKITEIEGCYNSGKNCYCQPHNYLNWKDVVLKNNIELKVCDNFLVF
ncbi:MAG: hypothetical protein H6680_07345 [Desulfobacteraceae bacterium]|nr:hypothetical protein [Desulfobacteraceae bacterium]